MTRCLNHNTGSCVIGVYPSGGIRQKISRERPRWGRCRASAGALNALLFDFFAAAGSSWAPASPARVSRTPVP